MAKALIIKKTRSSDSRTLVLEGPLDEHADYSSVSLAGVKTIHVDFKGVTMVNSAGTQKWVLFLKEVPEETKVIFEQCPVKIVHQMNLFPGFTAGKEVNVKSFFAPYHCDKQSKSYDFLLETDLFFKDSPELRAPPMFCPSCKEPLEFDAIEGKYFLFLKRQQKSQEDPQK